MDIILRNRNVSIYQGLSESALRANMEYAKRTSNHRLYTECSDVINLPVVEDKIRLWNRVIAATNNKVKK